ncbi:MAG: hypothetical protein HQK77_10440, partial [Desulfobacterales bacterium]|nr:hypothetical protein [Desulfobacterales bacterium]
MKTSFFVKPIKLMIIVLSISFCMFEGERSTSANTTTDTAASIPHPRLLWNQTWQDQWEQAKNTNNAWWVKVKEYADLAVSGNAKYQDGGIYPAIAYQVTKDSKYALAAYNILMPYPLNITTERLIGHYVIQIILVYDWIYNGLTSEQRQNAMNKVLEIGDLFLNPDCQKWCNNRIPRKENWFVGDSDETTFMYFYLALLEQAIAGESPRAGTFLNATPKDIYGVSLPIGGLDYSGTGGIPPSVSSTLRDAIYHYGESAAGGSWIESAEYNRATFKCVALAYQALKQITGQEHFPEYAKIMPDAGSFIFHEITPDLQQSVDWNDNEQPRTMNDPWARELPQWVNVMMALSGINRGIEIGSNLNQLIEELRIKYPTTAYAPLTGMGLMSFYPMDTKADWRNTLPKGFLASGMGHFRYKTGWNNEDSLFGAQMTTRVYVDHSVEYQEYSDPQGKHGYFGNFQLYRKGKWVITEPEGYGNQTGSMRNAMEIGNVPTMWELGPVANEWNDNYAYVAGLTQKSPDPPGWYNRTPDSFCNEWTRSLFYLPTTDKSADSIVIYDRVSSGQTKAWYLHTQEQATYQGNIATWNVTNTNSLPQPALTTSGTQKAQLTILSPQNVTTSAYPDIPGNTAATELKYTFKVAPSTSQTWDTFLNVVDVYDQGTAPIATKITSNAGSQDLAEGVQINRSGQNDAVVLFGANSFPASRILSNGYSVTFITQASTNTADIYFLDLSKTKEWTVKVDGNSFTALAINNKGIGTGVGSITVTGAGSHTITIASTQTGDTSTYYTLTKSVSPIDGGTISISPDKTSYTSGETVTLTATPNTGYSFVSWSGDATGTSSSVTITINANKSVIANFTQGQTQGTYTISKTVTPTDAGTISVSPDKTSYSAGETVTITATPNQCYTFTGWGNDASGSDKTTTITMNANKTITANFTKPY